MSPRIIFDNELKLLRENVAQMARKVEESYDELFVDTQMKILSNSVPLLNRIKDKFIRKNRQQVLHGKMVCNQQRG